jgi:hypothetical protein
MPNREVVSHTQVVKLLTAATVTADTNTSYVDMRGWDAVTFVVDNGTVTAAAPIATNQFALKLRHADATPASISSYADVAATDLTDALPVLGDGNATATIRQVGYVGNKRYAYLVIDETGTASADFAVYAVLQKNGIQPSNALTVTTGAVS